LNEETPFFADDGRRLYFSSEGHYTMGGYDIFFSYLDEFGRWIDPVNIGFPVNTTGEDLFYYPIADGNQGYLARIEREAGHTYSIYKIDIRDRAEGSPESSTSAGFKGDFLLYLIKPETGDTLLIRYNHQKNLFQSGDPAYQIIRKAP
jgi:hypothetical protein